MGEIVNLRRARKRATRAALDRQADRNRVLYGTPKDIEVHRAAEQARRDHMLDGHRLEKTSADLAPHRPDEQAAEGGEPREAVSPEVSGTPDGREASEHGTPGRATLDREEHLLASSAVPPSSAPPDMDGSLRVGRPHGAAAKTPDGRG